MTQVSVIMLSVCNGKTQSATRRLTLEIFLANTHLADCLIPPLVYVNFIRRVGDHRCQVSGLSASASHTNTLRIKRVLSQQKTFCNVEQVTRLVENCHVTPGVNI